MAHAKLTISLRITGVRADGYHLIDAEMVTLDLHDRLTVVPGASGLEATGPYAAGVPLDARNLVSRALAVSGRTAHVTIDKRIPHGGGLGGGSADAAAILRWAGVRDLERALSVGADVPFCLVGGRARVRGIGERIERLPPVDRVVTLVVPPLSVSTPAVYRAWDDLGGPTAEGPNDLQPAAISVEPELDRWRRLIAESCGETPVLAGSGATWWVPGDHGASLGTVRTEGAQVLVARTAPAPAEGG